MKPKPGEYGDLDSRAKFRARVADVLTLAEQCVKRAPVDPALRSIMTQLQVMKRNTANGRDPGPDERKGITAGLIAIRELDGTPDDEVAKLADSIHDVVAFYEDWPTDAAAAALAGAPRP
jgi:hypothetical protein